MPDKAPAGLSLAFTCHVHAVHSSLDEKSGKYTLTLVELAGIQFQGLSKSDLDQLTALLDADATFQVTLQPK